MSLEKCQHLRPSLGLAACLLLLLGQGLAAPAGAPTTNSVQITGIRLTGPPVIVFDHLRDKREPNHLPDAPVTAWKNADGTVNLTIPHFENYRMRGPDLEHLTSDPNKIFSSTNSASDIVESHFNYHHWFLAPYTLDGQTVYALTHTEWYACLLVGDCNQGNNAINSWATTNNSFLSTDGGTSWSVNGNNAKHLAVAGGDHWTGSQELSLRVYHKALNHSGLMTPSRLIREGGYYYSIGFEIHRDFSKLDLKTGVAPVDKYGYVLIRTNNITQASGWGAWVSGSTFHPLSRRDFSAFLPQKQGVGLNASQPQILFDVTTQTYIAIFNLWGNNGPVYYMTSKSLAAPTWSDAAVIAGTNSFRPDPRGPAHNPCNTGLNAGNYISMMDTNSSGMNFEFTSGTPWLFYVVNPAQCGGDNLARDLYRVKLSITYH